MKRDSPRRTPKQRSPLAVILLFAGTFIPLSCGESDPTGWYAGTATARSGSKIESIGARLRLVAQDKTASATLFLTYPDKKQVEMAFDKGSIVKSDIELTGSAPLGMVTWSLRGEFGGGSLTGTVTLQSMETIAFQFKLKRVADAAAAERIAALPAVGGVPQDRAADAREGTDARRPAGDPDRGRRTMADLRSIATACEAYAVDFNFYPTANSLDELRPMLSPTFIKRIPATDAWGNSFFYVGGSKTYEVRSLAKDGMRDTAGPRGASSDPASDIVFSNGRFTQWPQGLNPN